MNESSVIALIALAISRETAIAMAIGAAVGLGAAALTKRVRPGPPSKVSIALIVYFIAIMVAITWAFFRMAG